MANLFGSVTVLLDRPFDIDVHVAYIHLQRRHHRKFDLADPVGDFTSDGYLLTTGITILAVTLAVGYQVLGRWARRSGRID